MLSTFFYPRRALPARRERSGEFHSQSGDGSAFAIILLSSLVFFVSLLSLLVTGSSFFRALGLALTFQAIFVAMSLFVAFRRFMNDTESVKSNDHVNLSSDLSVEETIWKSFLSRDNDCKLGRIGFAAKVNEESCKIAEDLADEGYEVHLSSDIDAILNSIEESPRVWDILILDLDQYSDPGSAIDDLLVVRSVCQDLDIVLLSSEVSRDDFSLERKVVTDVTLRKPLSKRRLVSGLVSAHENASVRRGETLGSLIS
ncbi:hypothetical protein JQU17_21840 [Ponticoccus sp. SC2-23]|uniref:hypothetical protein n=1 Tax=Alexandriicola marinus TaxID=2081710 RepID=UPI000FD85914|nr:hypothetical protein [Alexandriicola marinus]MBM1222855.1 hypothetical protein [Ponticoccus sp. SC6-9]MBM1227237.1 hypothetical protein [Ponticoccus sp. SC6-15]MBM1231781.1 hypothetical protein [Ponticoccus sp. SC6-38]MBM1236354.1 hypothetical protein [Ponticoccus sp. SC6-45]MBM1240804.1 hypothetical protein [Ponticoccus sp. SC6-49]MBM1245339.1 hypothetical protein [Ponticoccus sp. SC2-64]MBM1249827.1 hypothetical protein [Ponticoccus sp. SC6-42]MBM1254297.1 hypothetical protein [Pontico